jgi:hypothetical protein
MAHNASTRPSALPTCTLELPPTASQDNGAARTNTKPLAVRSSLIFRSIRVTCTNAFPTACAFCSRVNNNSTLQLPLRRQSTIRNTYWAGASMTGI